MTVVVPFDPNYPRCAADGCDRPITQGSPSQWWCSWRCHRNWCGADDNWMAPRADGMPAPEMKGVYETEKRRDGTTPLDFAFDWMDVRKRAV